MSSQEENNIGEIIRKMELDYTSGSVTISDYVQFDMYETINRVEAYLNSKHISGDKDSQGRDKPFPNIVVSASNIWYRATDIDRKNIRIKATKNKDVVNAFLATIKLQEWMTKARFGQYLNESGRVASRFGSVVTKVIEKNGELIISTIPWNRLIVDPISFEGNPVIEVLELTEAQLRSNPAYDKEQVEELCNARKARETIDKRKKDNKNDYIKLYEIHGMFPLSFITDDEEYEEYAQQMHIVSFVESKKKGEYEQYSLFRGREKKNPYSICHLIKEDGRTLAIGAVEHLFEAQWMLSHTTKAIKDQLDLASKLIFQTSDGNFVGQNALSAIESGDILIHSLNQPLTQLANNSHDIESLQSFGNQWKSLGNEITGISEAMLGAAPKSGTAWRQTEALLQESYSLFELMTENRALYLEDLIREYVIPYIKKGLDTSKEVSAILEANDIEWLDSKFIKNYSNKEANRIIKQKLLDGEDVTQEQQQEIMNSINNDVQQSLKDMGNQRFIKPDSVTDKTWKEQFKDMEWDLEIDITGENKDYQSALATLNTALQIMMNPAFEQSPKAQMVVGEILKLTGTLSPLQISSIQKSTPQPSAQPPSAVSSAEPTLPAIK